MKLAWNNATDMESAHNCTSPSLMTTPLNNSRSNSTPCLATTCVGSPRMKPTRMLANRQHTGLTFGKFVHNAGWHAHRVVVLHHFHKRRRQGHHWRNAVRRDHAGQERAVGVDPRHHTKLVGAVEQLRTSSRGQRLRRFARTSIARSVSKLRHM